MTSDLKKMQNSENPARKEKPTNDHVKKECEVDGFIKTPGWFKLNGQLQHTNGVQLFGKVRPQLMEVKNKYGNESLVPFLEKKFKQRKVQFDDISLLESHIGYFITSALTNNNAISRKHYKYMETQIQHCKLQNPHTITGLLYYNICLSYIFKGSGKLGKAHLYMQKAKMEMKFNEPSTFTSYLYHIEAQLLIMIQTVQHKLCTNQKKRRQICMEAVGLYHTAREHWISQCNNDLFYPIYYWVQIIYIRLDMPTVYCMSAFQDSSRNIVLEFGDICTTLPEDIKLAEQILLTVKEQAEELAARHQPIVRGWVALAHIYINLRKTQLSIISGNDDLTSLGLYGQASKSYDDWCELNRNGFALTNYRWMQLLKADLKTILDKIESKLKWSPMHLGFDEDSNSHSSDVL